MAIADEEAPERVIIEETIEAPSPDRDGDDVTALPVASQVAPPQELLERVQRLEDKQHISGEATPVDMDEKRRLEAAKRRKQGWIVGGCVVLALAILGIVLGVTLGKKQGSTRGTVEPTPSPTREIFVSLQTLIESVSFDGGAALLDPLSPQYKALTWLGGNKNLEEYSVQTTIQRYVLAVVYYSTNGESWTESDGWLTDDDECIWFSDSTRLVCDESGTFNRLVLYDNNLVGPLPPEVAMLSDSLLSLAFMDDMLTGTLATELGLLSNLEAFFFVNTELNGTIPTELGRLTSQNLSAFFLHGAFLSGTIPSEIVVLPGVQDLSLSSNELLMGSIPTLIGMATNLRKSRIHFDESGDHRLTLTLLCFIGRLALFGTKVEGEMPTELGRLSLLGKSMAMTKAWQSIVG
jgi:hypothetical protein